MKKNGIDIRALTAWCLLGAYDWNSLLVQDNLFYESGAFILRENVPHPTLITKMISSLSVHGSYDHPLLAQGGWWAHNYAQLQSAATITEQPVLIAGQNKLSLPLSEMCNQRSIPNQCIDMNSNPDRLFITKYNPWAIIDPSAFDEIDVTEPDNFGFMLAGLCNSEGVRFVTLQMTDDYDSGEKILSLCPNALIVNIDPLNVLIRDQYLDILGATMDLLIDEESGIWELSANRSLTKSNGVATAKY